MDMSNPEEPDAESTGYSPTQADAERSIRAEIRRVEAAIIAKGDVDQRGNSTINGEVLEYATFMFSNIFKKTAAQVKADPYTQVITDPPNNYEPVPGWKETYTDDNGNERYDVGEPYDDSNGNGVCDEYKITWFDVPGASKAKISTTSWYGHGILVVEGDIEITGGIFDGALYVIGDLTFAAGNAQINGVIFVDGDVEDTTEIKGTTVISYDKDKILEAFGYNPIPFARAKWSEFYK
jgi:hypothetical protein